MNRKELAQLRRGITPKLRRFILATDDGGTGCEYCGFPATQIDHVVPISRGGGMALSNLVPACFECNHEKLDHTVEEWSQQRLAAGKPWPIPSFYERLCNFLARLNLTPEQIDAANADINAWMRNYPGGYKAIRAEFVRARDTTPVPA